MASGTTDQTNEIEEPSSRTHKQRGEDGNDEQDWWFASTAIPLIAAAIAPAANVFSIAALVSFWRASLYDANGTRVEPLDAISYPDPNWVYGTNITSLICGYLGNFFLFLNFTNRIPYIFALPITITLWYISFIILTGIQVSMKLYAPPGPDDDYTQAFWYGIIASVLYVICASMLLVNMLGYFLGHYSKHFVLTDSQRTLILQTFLFFIWLAGGAGVFQAIQEAYGTDKWNYSDALYFCDVTVLTIGYGDLTPDNDVGRGLVLPYSVGGIIMLGLMVSSIAKFAGELSDANISQKRVQKQRLHTLERTVTSEQDHVRDSSGRRRRARSIGAATEDEFNFNPTTPRRVNSGFADALKRTGTGLLNVARPKDRKRRTSLLVLREEKDRFQVMRKIQHSNARFKKWTTLAGSMTILISLWFVGALIFWRLELAYQGWSYFDAMYFCYISLLTIGYGDFTPKTNAGRPFFVLWSLLAVPSITLLISDLADTVVSSFNDFTNAAADFTVLAKGGVWRTVIQRNATLVTTIQKRRERKAEEKRVEEGFQTGADDEEVGQAHRVMTIEQLAAERQSQRNDHELAKRLAKTISAVAKDVKADNPPRYEYEQWVEYTELIRFTRWDDDEDYAEDDDDGLIEWDWIGENGPIMSSNEPAWLLDRLTESMNRWIQRQSRRTLKERPVDYSGSGSREEGEEMEEATSSSNSDLQIPADPRGRSSERRISFQG